MCINLTKKESIDTLNEMLVEKGLTPLTESEINDWGIMGGESNAQLQEWVNDFVSELHSENCVAKDAWRYEN